jgi:hypothetical protein
LEVTEYFKISNSLAASNGVYVFNSCCDFYAAANESVYLMANTCFKLPARTQFRYSALPGAAEQISNTNQTIRFVCSR